MERVGRYGHIGVIRQTICTIGCETCPYRQVVSIGRFAGQMAAETLTTDVQAPIRIETRATVWEGQDEVFEDGEILVVPSIECESADRESGCPCKDDIRDTADYVREVWDMEYPDESIITEYATSLKSKESE